MFIWLLEVFFFYKLCDIIKERGVLKTGVLSQTVVMNPYQCLCASVYPQQQAPSAVYRASSLYSSLISAYPVSPSVHLKIHKHHHYVNQQGSLQVMNPCSHWLRGWVWSLHTLGLCEGPCCAVCCVTKPTPNFPISFFSSGEGEDHRVKCFQSFLHNLITSFNVQEGVIWLI